MVWKIHTTTREGKLHHDAHIVVGTGNTKHRYVIQLDNPSAAHMTLLSAEEQAAVLAEVAALPGSIFTRPAPEPVPERTWKDKRQRAYSQQMKVSDQLEALLDADAGDRTKLDALQATYQEIKSAHPKPE